MLSMFDGVVQEATIGSERYVYSGCLCVHSTVIGKTVMIQLRQFHPHYNSYTHQKHHLLPLTKPLNFTHFGTQPHSTLIRSLISIFSVKHLPSSLNSHVQSLTLTINCLIDPNLLTHTPITLHRKNITEYLSLIVPSYLITFSLPFK